MLELSSIFTLLISCNAKPDLLFIYFYFLNMVHIGYRHDKLVFRCSRQSDWSVSWLPAAAEDKKRCYLSAPSLDLDLYLPPVGLSEPLQGL